MKIQWPTAINIALAVILAAATCGQLYVCYRQKQVFDRQDQEHAREAFNKALDAVEANRESCSEHVPTFSVHIPLDQAIKAEEVAGPLLTAAEYNRLAVLGSSELDSWKVEEYARKAEKKSQTKADHFASQLVIAHLHFCNINKDAELDKIQAVRQEFGTAIAILLPEEHISANKVRIGQAFALLAAHEKYMDKMTNSDEAWKKALAYLVGHCGPGNMVSELKDKLGWSSSGKPSISFLFKSPPSPVDIQFAAIHGSIPTIPVSVSSAPTLPGPMPAPAPALMPAPGPMPAPAPAPPPPAPRN
jgi:hypothetical protein